MSTIVDRGRRDRLQSIKKSLGSLDQSVARATWEWGHLLAEVDRDELWREDGATSFTEWLETEIDVSRASALRAIAVARHFSVDMAERFGPRKLAATVTYLELTAKDEQPGDVLALDFRVRGPSGAFVSVPFAEASVRQIEEACAEVRAAVRGKAEKARLRDLDADVRERARKLAEVLPAAPKGTVRGDRVAVKKGKDGRMAVSIQGIPVDELDAAIEALRSIASSK
jgi:hypothetical protein